MEKFPSNLQLSLILVAFVFFMATSMELNHRFADRVLFPPNQSALRPTRTKPIGRELLCIRGGGQEESETFHFHADIQELMGLIVNTFYSKKEIFLRELISNAVDALHKVRYKALTDESALADNPELDIRIIADKKNRKLIITDSGIGMTKEELQKSLGTVAHSGTKEYIKNAGTSNKEASLIGQFGVGFYSAFLVADSINVHSKTGGNDQIFIWSSDSKGTFTIRKAKTGDESYFGAVNGRGTSIILSLKEGLETFLDQMRLQKLIKKYSEFVPFEVKLWSESFSTSEEGPEAKILKKWELVNDITPLWLRPPDQVSQQDYEDFYRSIFQDFNGLFSAKHISIEGSVDFKGLVFIPRPGSFDPREKLSKKKNNFRLYVRQVLITDERATLCPEYLSFAKGVVNCDDIPLNISREMLQQTRILRIIQRQVAKKIIQMMEELCNKSPEEYKLFLTYYGKHIKWGLQEDFANRSKLIGLLRYPSLHSGDNLLGFKDYVNNMPADQSDIYYIIGESTETLTNSPLLERLKEKGYDVFLMTEPMDEYAMQYLEEYEGRRLVCASKEKIGLDASNEQNEQQKKRYANLCQAMENILGTKVEEVVVSQRLVNSPCTLVTKTHGTSANMERILKAQAMLHDPSIQQFMKAGKVLEINPDNPIIRRLRRMVKADDGTDTKLQDAVNLMYQSALLSAGFPVENAADLSARIFRLIDAGLRSDEDEL